MKKILVLLGMVMIIAISGCAMDQGSSSGGWGSSSGHQGHH